MDRDATVLAYLQVERGGADMCDCSGCRNFRLARAQAFPRDFLALLDELGIDALKDAEVSHVARLASGHHIYEGWYHFVGALEHTGDFPPVHFGDAFRVWMCHASAPRLPSLKGKPVVQLEFDARAVPWLLDEEELP
ncbi:MAG TPA: hypothetical protein VHR64_15920 [Thermomicrobiales bacterium]|nr:hypothetical protein [Thermomicrobiales bacterium]